MLFNTLKNLTPSSNDRKFLNPHETITIISHNIVRLYLTFYPQVKPVTRNGTSCHLAILVLAIAFRF